MTPDISSEWKRHSHRFARAWRVSMEARRKVHHVNVLANDPLHEKIRRFSTNAKDRETMLKDILLIEAAAETDRTVISLDETARKLFGEAASHVGELRNIVWVNPEKTGEEPISWLERGAKAEKKRLLGSRSGGS